MQKSFMAQIHPSLPLYAQLNAGGYRERDILLQLMDGLPAGFDIFHNLQWSTVSQGEQHIGELDIVVVSPIGHLLILEVKAGDLEVSDGQLVKNYGQRGTTVVQNQTRRQHGALLSRLKDIGLAAIRIESLLVLPDYRVSSEGLGYARERIVDASDIDQLCSRVRSVFAITSLSAHDRQKAMDFLSNRFAVMPDVASHIGQLQQVSTHLSSGLATWVPKISHPDQTFVIEATAGSGKTQLALALLSKAAATGKRTGYICFNRPLADHLTKLAPTSAEVTNFHQLCRDVFEAKGQVADFAQSNMLSSIVDHYLEVAEQQEPKWDLLIIDESQDFEHAWVESLLPLLKDDGYLYVMGDPAQQLYERESFEMPNAVRVQCMDNFRSPRRIVELINQLGLTPEPIVARSVFVGELPYFNTFASGQVNSLTALNARLQALWDEGFTPEQVVVVTWGGLGSSMALKQERLGGELTQRFKGQYDSLGNPIWTPGNLRVESVYRFKGQSAPAVVLCEVDFDRLTDKDKRKLVVGLTRGQMKVDIVLSESAAKALSEYSAAAR